MLQRHALLLLALGLILLAITTVWVYAPGLHGNFLFDDFGSLPALGAHGPVTRWSTFWRYITSGTADPTGRPLSMLTFLLDARNWPADPYPFKRTNLLLHLINGALLYALLLRLGNLLDNGRRNRLAAALGCALWLLHPLLVSTTLYIVQREAMLVATCVMSGLLLWLQGRQRLMEGDFRTGTLLSVGGLAGFTLLGTLAKANGLLLPLFALLIELIVLAKRHPMPDGMARRVHRLVLLVFALIPATVVVGYVLWTGLQGMWSGGTIGVRSWSVGQRLLTEPRVLLDYLKLLWLPRPFSSGLFNDQYIASTSWLHPLSTIPALLTIIALVAGAWWQRKRHPALALAVLFYFSGQLLESTSIPLELYFEHRNYTPALLMFWPLGLWLADSRQLRAIKIVLMVTLPLALAGMTHARARLWGDVQTQALTWARINPASPRAQANAADVEIHNGHAEAAARKLRELLKAQPDQAQLAFSLITSRCTARSFSPEDLQTAQWAVRHTANTGSLFVRWFEQMLPVANTGRCPGLTTSALLSLIDAGLENPKLDTPGLKQDLTFLRGRVDLATGHPDLALKSFISAFDLLPKPSVALKAAANLGQDGYPEYGLRMLDHYELIKTQPAAMSLNMATVHNWVLARQGYWPHEVSALRTQLILDSRKPQNELASPASQPSTPH